MCQYLLRHIFTSIMRLPFFIATFLLTLVNGKKEINCTMDTGYSSRELLPYDSIIVLGLRCFSDEPLELGTFKTIKSRCKNGRYPKKEKCTWRFAFTDCKPIINCDYIDLRKGSGKRYFCSGKTFTLKG